MSAIDDLAKRIEDNLKLTDGPGMDIRFTMNRDAAEAFALQLRVTAQLVDAHTRLRLMAKRFANAIVTGQRYEGLICQAEDFLSEQLEDRSGK